MLPADKRVQQHACLRLIFTIKPEQPFDIEAKGFAYVAATWCLDMCN